MNENLYTIDQKISDRAQEDLREMFDTCLVIKSYKIANKHLEEVKTTFKHYKQYREALDYLLGV